MGIEPNNKTTDKFIGNKIQSNVYINDHSNFSLICIKVNKKIKNRQ